MHRREQCADSQNVKSGQPGPKNVRPFMRSINDGRVNILLARVRTASVEKSDPLRQKLAREYLTHLPPPLPSSLAALSAEAR